MRMKTWLFLIFGLLPILGCLKEDFENLASDSNQVVLPNHLRILVAEDLNDVIGARELSEESREILVDQQCLILPTQETAIYDLYGGDEFPFVTSDSLVHAYHVLTQQALNVHRTEVLEPLFDELLKDLQADHELLTELTNGAELARLTLNLENSEERAAAIQISLAALATPNWEQLKRASLLAKRRYGFNQNWSAWDLVETITDALPPGTPLTLDAALRVELPNLGRTATFNLLPGSNSLLATAIRQIEGTDQELLSGIDLLYLLGDNSARLSRNRQEFLKHLETHRWPEAEPEQNVTLERLEIDMLGSLSRGRGRGYPSFSNSDLWRRKTRNSQRSGWIEGEFGLKLQARSLQRPSPSVGNSDLGDQDFVGYVEPSPEFFARLAHLCAETRNAFRQAGLFSTLRDLESAHRSEVRLGYRNHQQQEHHERMSLREYERRYDLQEALPSEHDFLRLERLALHLEQISSKQLGNSSLNEEERSTLRTFHQDLRELCLNRTKDRSPESPLLVLGNLGEDEFRGYQRQAGTAAPLKLLVLVPYRGKLYWTAGGVLSYCEFQRSLGNEFLPAEWAALQNPPASDAVPIPEILRGMPRP